MLAIYSLFDNTRQTILNSDEVTVAQKQCATLRDPKQDVSTSQNLKLVFDFSKENKQVICIP